MIKNLLFIAMLVSVAACSHHVVLEQDFPEPVMRKADQAVVVLLTDQLRNYTHKEEPEGGATWTIDFGNANARLFESIFRGMFSEVTLATSLDEVPDNATVITPLMKDFQFSTPGMSKSEYYEVWIKYRLVLSSPKQKVLHEWPVTAYGREETSGKSASNAMREAGRRAMRDAAAAIVLNYQKQAAVKAHFAAREDPR